MKEELGNSLGRKLFLTEEKLQSNAEESRCPGNSRILPLQENVPVGGLACSLPTDGFKLRLLLAFIFKALPPKTAFAESLPSASLLLCLCYSSLHSVCSATSFFSRARVTVLLKVKVRE